MTYTSERNNQPAVWGIDCRGKAETGQMFGRLHDHVKGRGRWPSAGQRAEVMRTDRVLSAF